MEIEKDEIMVPYVRDECHNAPKYLLLQVYSQIELTSSREDDNRRRKSLRHAAKKGKNELDAE